MKRKRTEITVEIEEVFYSPSCRTSAWCAWCEREVHLISPQQAAVIAGTTVYLINDLVEDGRLHYMETSPGQFLVCVNSLIRISQTTEENVK